jgi:hypothetical protein
LIAEVNGLTHNVGYMTFLPNLFRSAKRRIFSGGYARPVHTFLQLLPEMSTTLPKGEYVVNISFDLEHAYNTPYWEGEFETALTYGRRSFENFVPISTYLRDEAIPHNVQVVGLLLEKDLSDLPYMNRKQGELVRTHPELFTLTPEQSAYLTESHVDVGLHGYSHRLFSSLSEDEVRNELERARKAFATHFGERIPPPTFMSFPRNNVAHEDVLREQGVRSWRMNHQMTKGVKEIPLGLWFAPGTLGVTDLRKVLKRIRNEKESFLLHVWSHYTEMDVETFKAHIEVMREEGWKFKNVRDMRNEYER